jgi:transposase
VLLPPHLVRPHVTRDKTDRNDATGLLEAYRNKEIQTVPIKSLEQQGLTALHRLRSAWQAERTARQGQRPHEPAISNSVSQAGSR